MHSRFFVLRSEASYHPPIPMQRKSRVYPEPEERITEPAIHTRRRLPRLLWLLAGGVLLLWGLSTFTTQALTPFLSQLSNQWQYGDARITQLDADVGHQGISHFVAEYERGAIVVFELSLADYVNAHIYTVAGFLASPDTLPVITLATTDRNGDGRPDLVIGIQGTTFMRVFFNTGTAFTAEQGA